MPLYEHYCNGCHKQCDVLRPISQSGEPYACPSCGINTDRIYSAVAEKEFFSFYTSDGKRIGTRKQDMANLKAHGRVLTQETNGWRDIKKMAKEGQRRTKLQQKGHY